jgi:hypothetical protein
VAPRRYYLLKALVAAEQDDDLAFTWRAKQAALAGAALAADFPARATLVAAGYSTTEDLDGADADELTRYAGLTRSQADAAIAALE